MARRFTETKEKENEMAMISQDFQKTYERIKFFKLPEIAMELILTYVLWDKHGIKTKIGGRSSMITRTNHLNFNFILCASFVC